MLRDQLVDRELPLAARLELDPDAPGVHRAAVVADGAHHHVGAGDVRVLRDDLGHPHLVSLHVLVADALRRFRIDHQPALIFARQEPGRHQREQVDGADEQRDRDRHDHRLRSQAEAQRPVVQPQPALEDRFDGVVEPAVPGECGGFRKRLQSIGVRLIDTKPEIRMATPIVTANSCSRRPTMPPMNSTGMNTAASDTRHRRES